MVFSAGERLTGAQLNTLDDTATEALKPPTALVLRSTALTLTTATPTAITFDTEQFDNDSMFGGPSTQIHINTAGLYLVTGYSGFGASATGQRTIAIDQDGTLIVQTRTDAAASGVTHLCVSALVLCTTSTVFKLSLEQNSGGNLNTSGTPRLSVVYQSAA